MYASKSIEFVYFVPATTIVPRKWDGWFWQQISDNAPFSWGDNDHTLVNAEDFARHCEERLDKEKADHLDKYLSASNWAKAHPQQRTVKIDIAEAKQ